MIEVAFFVSATMCIMGALVFIGYIVGNSFHAPLVIPFPGEMSMGPTHFLIIYPSMMFQVSFWADLAGLFV